MTKQATEDWLIVTALILFVVVIALGVTLSPTSAQQVQASEGMLRELRLQLQRECRPVFDPISRCRGSLTSYPKLDCPEGRELVHQFICGDEPGVYGSLMIMIEPTEGPAQKGGK